MFDLTDPTWLSNNIWYDPEASDNDKFNAYLKDQERSDYNLGDYLGDPTGDMWLYGDLKVKAKQETADSDSRLVIFNTNRNDAYEEMQKRHDEETVAFHKDQRDSSIAEFGVSIPFDIF